MATRRYDFSAGFESSESPSGTDPVSGTDFVSLSYANTNYALRADFGYDVASYAALKALTTSGDNARQDGQVRLVTGTGELWYFDADSVATDDGATILQPDSGSGRWLIASASGASSSGTGGPSLQSLAQKIIVEEYSAIPSFKFDNSVSVSSVGYDNYADVTGNFLDDYATSGQSQVALVWGAQVLSNSDRNLDSTTSWTAVQDGTTLTATNTAGEFKVGTHALKFNKSNTAVKAGIRFDRGSQNFSTTANYRLFFWVKLPSLTNLSNVYVRMYDSGTTNYAEWNLTTDLDGTALVADWNLCFVDLSTTPSTTGGSGWTKNTSSRYAEFGVTASSSAQTYTGIIFDAIYFGFGDIDRLGVKGKEYTVYNSSSKESIVIDQASPSGDGLVTLGSNTTVAWEGGQTNSNAFIRRSTSFQNNGYIGFDPNLTSGTVGTSQEYRAHRTLRESVNGTIDGFVDFEQPEVFRITSVGASAVSGEDFAAVSGNCLSGDVFDVYSVYYDREGIDYIYKTSVTLNANSSSSGSTLNLPLASVGTVSGGDFMSKRAITSQMSLVGLTSNESFQTFTLKDEPDNKFLINNANPIPFLNEVNYWFKLGGLTRQQATVNRGRKTSSISSLTVNGSPRIDNAVVDGMYALSASTNTADYLEATGATDINMNSSNTLEFLCWLRFPSAPSTDIDLWGAYDNWSTTANGWKFNYEIATNSIRVVARTASSTTENNLYSTATIPVGKWFLWYFFGYETSNTSTMWVNGLKATDGLTGIPNFTPIVRFNPAGNHGVQMSEMIIFTQRDSATRLVTDDMLTQINNGGPKAWEIGLANRYQYRQTAQSGQRLSMKVTQTRGTTASTGLRVKRFGAIKI